MLTVSASHVPVQAFDDLRKRLNALCDLEHSVEHFSIGMEQRDVLDDHGMPCVENIGVVKLVVAGTEARRNFYTMHVLREMSAIFRAEHVLERH